MNGACIDRYQTGYCVYILRGERDGATMHRDTASIRDVCVCARTGEIERAATPSILHAIKTYLALHYVSGGV